MWLCNYFQTIDRLIETGNSEQIFETAIQGHGRGQVNLASQNPKPPNAALELSNQLLLLQIMDTLAEIQERCDTVKEIEKKLYDLQQVYWT